MKLRQHASALEMLDRAKAALAADRPAQALQHAMASLEASPDSIEAMLLIAKLHLITQSASDAMRMLDRASLHDDSSSHQTSIDSLRAQSLWALNRLDESIALFTTLIAKHPSDAQLRRLCAGVCEQAGRNDEAIAQLEHSLKLDPSDATAARTLARLEASHNPEASIDRLERTTSSMNSAMQWQRTQWMKQAGRDRDAAEAYRELLAQSLDDGSLWIEAAEHADRQGSLALATQRYQHALETRSCDKTLAITGLARTFMHAGQFAQATWFWWQATRLNQTSTQAWAGLIVSALCCDRGHIANQAQKRLESIADEDERSFALAEGWLEAGAGEVIQRLTQPAKAPAITASPLTWILQQSTQTLSTQVVRKPGWADTLYHTAICEAALGETDCAREHVQAALDINPNYKAATTLAARLPKAA